MRPDYQLNGDQALWACDQRDPRTIGPRLYHDGANLRCTDGRPETRKGVVKPPWANRIMGDHVEPHGTPFGLGRFQDPEGVEWFFVAADGYIYRSRPYNLRVQVPLPTGVKIFSRCLFVQAFNELYCFRGRQLAPLRLRNLDTGFIDLCAHWSSTPTYAVNTEVSFGPFINISSITRLNQTATVVTAADHGYVSGADITIAGAVQTEYNGRFNIFVVDATTFTYSVGGSPAISATGTKKCSNQIFYWKALGTVVTLTGLTWAAGVATATKAAHGYSTGQSVTIAGASPNGYNGTFTITVPTADTFTYPLAVDPTAATVMPTARNSLVLAGQSPDTHPTSWQRVYNILPNAAAALYLNNRLLVATAYEPASSDNYSTFNGGGYQKVDFIVATSYLDPLHFDFLDEFRINQGSDDEIVDLARIANDETVVVWKGHSWGVLSNVRLDLSDVRWDGRSNIYGLSGQGAWAETGQDLKFLSAGRGIVSIAQSEAGKLIGSDEPLSAPIQRTIDRINWSQISRARMANWNNRLYCAVPFAEGTVGIPAGTTSAILVFDFTAAAKSGDLTQGWTPIDTGAALTVVEWLKIQLNGQERLLFVDAAGYVSLIEESDAGDQITNSANPNGLGWVEIETRYGSRSLTGPVNTLGLQKAADGLVWLETWNPQYTIQVKSANGQRVKTICADKTRSRTRYIRPFNRPAWDPSNVNDDHGAADREDYSVALPSAGINLGAGVNLLQFAETPERFHLAPEQARDFRIEIIVTQGRVRLIGSGLAVAEGVDRAGVLT